MADPSFISQEAIEAAADESEIAISQEAIEVSPAAGGGNTAISQEAIELASDESAIFISQLCIEYSLGDEIPPPPEPPSTGTFVFDEGGGVEWWIIPQLVDSGIELRDKVVKAVRVTGLVTDADVKVYTYGPADPVVVSDLEDGINSVTGAVPLDDTTNVAQSQRWQVNCPNAMLSTVRVAGVWDGESPRNRVDEIEYEVAQSGVRR